MKAMILAAGFGSRMQPLTLTTPKPLVQLRGQALIDYHLTAFKKISVHEIAINVHHLGEKIIAYVQQRWGNDFKFNFFTETEILGTGGGIHQALSLFDNQPFIVVSADIFTEYPLERLPKVLTGLAHLVMVDNPLYHPRGDFYLNTNGLLSLTQGLRLTYGNIGMFHPQLFASVKQPKFELREVLFPAIEKQKISGEHYTGPWENIGTLVQLEALNQYK
jgi:MurNAc alpha-1-phosphate uridylyltransferase